jgi:hypothetical protein
MPSFKICPKTITLGLAMMATAAILLFSMGCESNPGTPEYNNVFDEANHTGNPLNLTAVLAGGTILVSWDQPQEQGITSYNIYHGTSYSQMDLDTTVVHTDKPDNKAIYSDPTPTETHFFRISALTNQSFSYYTDQTPAEASTAPLVIVGDGGTGLASRYAPVTVTVSKGEYLLIADNPEFTNALRDTIVADGTPQIIPWDFGTAADNTVDKALHFQAYNDFYTSPVDSLSLNVNFRPLFKVEGSPATVPTRIFNLEIPVDGVLEMRFSDSEENLAVEPWIPAAEIYPNYELADMASTQTIYGEFRGDFGFDEQVSLAVTPELLDDASFYLSLPQDHVTDDSQIQAICSAEATLMRFSESMDFAATPWTAYADTVIIQLSPDPGRKVIYAQFRNDWADSPLLTDYADYISQPGQVTFLAPVDGSILEGGTSFNILGISSAASGLTSVVGVELDLGDGSGYFALTGTDTWSHLWDIPTYEVDTDVVLRALAYTSTDTVHTFVTVTVPAAEEATP